VVTLPYDDDDDGESDEPAWMEKFRSPESLGRAVRDAAETLSEEAGREEEEEDDDGIARARRAGTSGRTRGEGEDPFDDAPAGRSTGTTETTRRTGLDAEARKPAPAPKTTDGSSTSVDLVATSNLGGKSKVLFEIEGAGEAVDLDGDTGAVGRWLAESARSLKVDMKGVMYNARVAPCAGTVVVVAVNADQAKIESVHREYVQLREDPNAMGGMQNLGVGSLFDDAEDDAEDEDDRFPDTETAATAGSKRKRSTAAAASSSAKSRGKPRGRSRAGGSGAKSRAKKSKK